MSLRDILQKLFDQRGKSLSMSSTKKPLLQVTNLSKTFGGLSALRGITLEAKEGQIVGIIGPNGAGKTTLFNCLTGLYYPSTGQIYFENRPIAPEIPERIQQWIYKCSSLFLIFSLLWAPIFWAIFIPKTYYKVEITLLTLFFLSLRFLVFRGLRDFQIWAWGLVFVWLIADIYLAVWTWVKIDTLSNFPGTELPLKWLTIPWSIPTIGFSGFFLYLIFTKDARNIFGFRIGPDCINRFGISRTFQNIRLFSNLSVLDNVKIGAHGRMTAGVFY